MSSAAIKASHGRAIIDNTAKQALRIARAKRLDDLGGRLLAFFMARRQPTEPPCAPGRILFIKFWGIGSIILCEPSIRELRRQFPDAELHFLTLSRNRDLFALFPHKLEIHLVRFGAPLRTIFALIRTVLKLRSKRFDRVYDAEFFTNSSAIVARLAKARHVTGFTRAGAHRGRLLDKGVEFLGSRHAQENFMALAGASVNRALPDRVRPVLRVPSRQGASGPVPLPQIVLNVNASALALERRWPGEYFIDLGRRLLHHFDCSLVFIGSRDEREYTRSIADELEPYGRVVNTAGTLDLGALAATLRSAALLISNDSGPMHLAAALDTPVVGFFGPELETRFGPLATRRLILSLPLSCRPCMSIENAKTVNCTNRRRCMRDLKPAVVWPRIHNFIDSLALAKKCVAVTEAGGAACSELKNKPAGFAERRLASHEASR